MDNTKKYILVVEQNPVLCDMFNAVFLYSGYDVQTAHGTAEALEMIIRGDGCYRPFDLVVVDISDGKHAGLVADLRNINGRMPVLLLKDGADKSMVIDLLNRNLSGFIDFFIQSNAGACEIVHS